MRSRGISICLLVLLAVLVILPMVGTALAQADALEDAIAAAPKGTEKGMIDPDAATGFLDIPGKN